MTEKKRRSYDGKVGCWNCDIVYDIPIKKGTNVPEFLIKTDQRCKKCGCSTLRILSEYKAEKKIMKDLMLHHRIEQMGGDPTETGKSHDHYK